MSYDLICVESQRPTVTLEERWGPRSFHAEFRSFSMDLLPFYVF